MSPDEASRIAAGPDWCDLSVKQEVAESDPDAELVALGRRFEALSAELELLQREEVNKPSVSAQHRERPKGEARSTPTAERIDALLRSLDPIERAIMAMPAMTVVGLGVKAHHAAHVFSHYWSSSPDRLDWDARTVRLLIESTCSVAGVGLRSLQQRESKHHEAASPH